MADKASLQEAEYDFPYHFLPQFDSTYGVRRSRQFPWAHEYLCYLERIVEMVQSHPINVTSLLDVGCGDGRLISELRRIDASIRLVGCDLSSRAIAFASALNDDAEFVDEPVGSVNGLFDVVTAIETLEHVPDDEVRAFLDATVDRVRPGGRLVVCVPSVNLALSAKHFRHYTAESLRAEVEQGRGLICESVEYVCSDSWLDGLYRHLTLNRWMALHSAPLDRLYWRLYKWRSQRSSSRNGLHVMGVWKHSN